MNTDLKSAIKKICQKYEKSSRRMMDIVRDVQQQFGCVSGDSMEMIAAEVGTHRVEVESVVSFYAFLSEKRQGKVVIRLCDDIIDQFHGVKEVAKAFEEAAGITFGETTPDGMLTLQYTPCIGMSDQAPAALVNDVVVTNLNAKLAREIVDALKKDPDPAKLVEAYGDGNNSHDLVRSAVMNNIRAKGEVIFSEYSRGTGLTKALAMSPTEVIKDVKTARLRGRGGAGFPAGMKWEFTRAAAGAQKAIICNADEGEPGTFKDRVLLTERADLLFEGMTIAAYAIGASEGILYLRAEYAYLRAYIEAVLAERRQQNLLGNAVCGKDGFDFDIRIQMGAGAYICGEETSLISSCEGLRGDPKTRPPFPAQKGYLGHPTSVNNVETLCCVPRILDKGAGWFAQIGHEGSTGTKVLSVSGDCRNPGIYEVPFGTKLSEFLTMCDAEGAMAVQMGGPSGHLVGRPDFDREICYEDLSTGGSVMVFGPDRDLFEIVHYFMKFFVEESCGYCTPCRVGNILLQERLERIMEGKGEPSDIPYLERLGDTIKVASRCGFGQTSPNPVLSLIKNFRDQVERKLKEDSDRLQPAFDLASALKDAEAIAGRASIHSH